MKTPKEEPEVSMVPAIVDKTLEVRRMAAQIKRNMKHFTTRARRTHRMLLSATSTQCDSPTIIVYVVSKEIKAADTPKLLSRSRRAWVRFDEMKEFHHHEPVKVAYLFSTRFVSPAISFIINELI